MYVSVQKGPRFDWNFSGLCRFDFSHFCTRSSEPIVCAVSFIIFDVAVFEFFVSDTMLTTVVVSIAFVDSYPRFVTRTFDLLVLVLTACWCFTATFGVSLTLAHR